MKTHDRLRRAALWRVAWTVISIICLQGIVCGLAVLPVYLVWMKLLALVAPNRVAGILVFSLVLVPSYVAFAVFLMFFSAVATRVTGARTPVNAQMCVAEMGWPLMRWARYMVAIHIVRVLAGTFFRGSPIWTAYLRLNGARIGRRVYVNSLFISDHNLLEFGDDVVVGSEVHLSGHTVEAGIVKTAEVRLGPRVTIGLGTVVDIGVIVGADCQVGALSLVPKHVVLEEGAIYAGIPVRRIDQAASKDAMASP